MILHIKEAGSGQISATDKKNTGPALATLVWPIYLETTMRLLLGNVNVFMLSRYSDKAVGAVGVSNQIVSLVLVMYGIVSMGTGIIVSQYVGSGDKKNASRVASVALVVNLSFGLFLSLVMVIFGRLLLKTMNLSEDMLEYAYEYIAIVGAASFLQALIAAMSVVSRSYGQTRLPMCIAFGMNLVNIVGNYICLFRPFGIPVFGVKGVAISLVTSEIIAAAAMYIKISSKLGVMLRFRDFSPFPKDIMKTIIKVGAPAAGESMSYNFSQMATTYIVATFGANAITAKVYASSLAYFSSALGTAIGMGTQILVGQLIGAGDVWNAGKICMKALRMALTANITLAFSFFILRFRLAGVFTQNKDIISIVTIVLTIDMMVEIGRAANNVIGCALRGAGDVRFPAYISVLSMWGVSVLLCIILGIVFKLGLPGIWAAFAADECFRSFLMLRRWRSKAWEKMAVIR